MIVILIFSYHYFSEPDQATVILYNSSWSENFLFSMKSDRFQTIKQRQKIIVEILKNLVNYRCSTRSIKHEERHLKANLKNQTNFEINDCPAA